MTDDSAGMWDFVMHESKFNEVPVDLILPPLELPFLVDEPQDTFDLSKASDENQNDHNQNDEDILFCDEHIDDADLTGDECTEGTSGGISSVTQIRSPVSSPTQGSKQTSGNVGPTGKGKKDTARVTRSMTLHRKRPPAANSSVRKHTKKKTTCARATSVAINNLVENLVKAQRWKHLDQYVPVTRYIVVTTPYTKQTIA